MSNDLQQAEGTFLGCCLDLVVGLSMIFGGLFVNILAWTEGRDKGICIFAAILFLFCLAMGAVEIKGAIEGLKKLK